MPKRGMSTKAVTRRWVKRAGNEFKRAEKIISLSDIAPSSYALANIVLAVRGDAKAVRKAVAPIGEVPTTLANGFMINASFVSSDNCSIKTPKVTPKRMRRVTFRRARGSSVRSAINTFSLSQ